MTNHINLTEQSLLLLEAEIAGLLPIEAEIANLQREVNDTERKVSDSNSDRSLTIEARSEIGYRGAVTVKVIASDIDSLTVELNNRQDEAIKLGIGAYNTLGAVRDHLRAAALTDVTEQLLELVELHPVEYSALAMRSRVVKELDAVADMGFSTANRTGNLSNLSMLRPIFNEYLSIAKRYKLA